MKKFKTKFKCFDMEILEEDGKWDSHSEYSTLKQAKRAFTKRENEGHMARIVETRWIYRVMEKKDFR